MAAILSPGFIGPTPAQLQQQRQQGFQENLRGAASLGITAAQLIEQRRQFEIASRLQILQNLSGNLGLQNYLTDERGKAVAMKMLGPMFRNDPAVTETFVNDVIQSGRSAEDWAKLVQSQYAAGKIVASPTVPTAPIPPPSSLDSSIPPVLARVPVTAPEVAPLGAGITYTPDLRPPAGAKPTSPPESPKAPWPPGMNTGWNVVPMDGKGNAIEMPPEWYGPGGRLPVFDTEESAKTYATTTLQKEAQGLYDPSKMSYKIVPAPLPPSTESAPPKPKEASTGWLTIPGTYPATPIGDAAAKQAFFDAVYKTYKDQPALLGGIVPKSQTPEEMAANNAQAFSRWKSGEPLTGALWGRAPSSTPAGPISTRLALSSAITSKVADRAALDAIVGKLQEGPKGIDTSKLTPSEKVTWEKFVVEQGDAAVADTRRMMGNPATRYQVISSITDSAVRKALESGITTLNEIGLPPNAQPMLSQLFIDTAGLNARAAEASIKATLARAGLDELQAVQLIQAVSSASGDAALEYMKVNNARLKTVLDVLQERMKPYQAGLQEAATAGKSAEYLKKLRMTDPDYVRLENDVAKQLTALAGDNSVLRASFKEWVEGGKFLGIIGPEPVTKAYTSLYREPVPGGSAITTTPGAMPAAPSTPEVTATQASKQALIDRYLGK